MAHRPLSSASSRKPSRSVQPRSQLDSSCHDAVEKAAAATRRLDAVINSVGVVVNISGVIAEQNLPGMVAYGASKAAVAAFDQGLTREARRSGVRVLDARPPHTETGLADRPIEGTAPRMPDGLSPARVAQVICDGIASGTTELPSTAF